MSRSLYSSLGESVHSLHDSMGGEEFLVSSPFNPKNLELRRKQREAKVNKTAFQPQFCRVDSMEYRGRGIVEDNDNVAPIAFAPPAPTRPRQPSYLNGSHHDGSRTAGRPPLPQHIVSDNNGNRVASATRRRANSREPGAYHYVSPATTSSVAVPAPPPPPPAATVHIPAPPVSTTRRTVHAPAPLPTNLSITDLTSPSDSDASSPPLSPEVVVETPQNTKTTSKAPGRVSAPVKQPVAAPVSPAGPPPEYVNSPPNRGPADARSPVASAAAAMPQRPPPQRVPHLPLPPRAPTTTTTTATTSTTAASPARQTQEERRMRLVERLHLGNEGRHTTLHMDRRKKVDLVNFTAPLSPSKPRPSDSDNGTTLQRVTAQNMGATATTSSSSQSSIPALPPLLNQPSSDGQLSPQRVQRRNSSPLRVRRSSTGVPAPSTPSPAMSKASPRALAPSPPLSALPTATTATATTGSTSDFSSPVFATARVKPSTSSSTSSSNATTNKNGAAASNTSSSTEPRITPRRHGRVPHAADTSLRAVQQTTSDASPASAAMSVPSGPSSGLSSPASATPVATPSATLRLMAEKTQNRRLAAAARVDVRQSPSPAGFVFAERPAPPAPPSRPLLQRVEAGVVPSPVAVRTTNAPTLLSHYQQQQKQQQQQQQREKEPSLQSSPKLVNAAANDALMNRIKNTQQQKRRSLVSESRTSMCDSVRRMYYCMPLEEETSIPTFARRAGDLHLSPDVAADGNRRSRVETPSSTDDEVSESTSVASTTARPQRFPVAPVVPAVAAASPTLTSASTPALTPPAKGRESSAVRQDYFLDVASPSTGDDSQVPTWTPQSERFILPDGSDVPSDSDGDDSDEEMEPLMLDAVRAFNRRFA